MTKPPTFTASGLLVCDKPQGWTSHQVVGRVRRLLGTRKVGHAGTLDPMATGVLLVGVNRATRLLGHLALHDKRYEATIRLGQSTSTDDAEGEPTGGADASLLQGAEVAAALPAFRGVIQQRPSSVSAIKVNGQRAYKLVRDGQQVELAEREVTVSRYEVLAVRHEGPFCDVDVEVECSSGTYVRALARDLGQALEVSGNPVGGHLTALRRTRIGGYNLTDLPVVDLESDERPALLSMAEAARLSFPVVQLDEAADANVRFGRSLALQVPANPTGLLGPDGELVALYRPDADDPGTARPVAVLV